MCATAWGHVTHQATPICRLGPRARRAGAVRRGTQDAGHPRGPGPRCADGDGREWPDSVGPRLCCSSYYKQGLIPL